MVHPMQENLDTGRGPAPQAHSALGAQQLERSFRELLDRRDKQHLGSTFHVIGGIMNFVPALDNNFKYGTGEVTARVPPKPLT